VKVPFRLGTTSFIYPGGWLANVERLAGHFSDVEILFFETDGPDSLPSQQEREGLAEWKLRADLTYSLHTPLDVSLASTSEHRRRDSVVSIERAIQAAIPFQPEAYVLHVYLGECEKDLTPPTDLAGWRRRAARSLEEILCCGVKPSDLCIEVLDYDFGLIEPVVRDLDLSIALDVGHLVRDGRNEEEVLQRHLQRTRVLQWHGLDPSSRDHRSIAHYPRDRARRLLDTLIQESYRGVLTLEVFREADLEDSLAVLTSLLSEMGA
jgi:sugar phosphate isomerase/epimerase